MNYYLWVDGSPCLWWVAKGKAWNNITGMWFFDRNEWVTRYPGHPADAAPGDAHTKEQLRRITKEEAFKVMLSPTREVVKPILDKYGVDTEGFSWGSK